MAKTYETEQVQEKFLLAAVDLEDGTDVSYSLDELAELTETAGGHCSRKTDSKKRVRASGNICR